VEPGLFRLIATPNYDPDDEEWEFLPGSLVRVTLHRGSDGEFPVAVKP
jgi:hypothetical protein